MGLRPTQADEKPLPRASHEFVISTGAKRSGEICGFLRGLRHNELGLQSCFDVQLL
jgi:hypothetical protein